jgi:hypothetical protein
MTGRADSFCGARLPSALATVQLAEGDPERGAELYRPAPPAT